MTSRIRSSVTPAGSGGGRVGHIDGEVGDAVVHAEQDRIARQGAVDVGRGEVEGSSSAGLGNDEGVPTRCDCDETRRRSSKPSVEPDGVLAPRRGPVQAVVGVVDGSMRHVGPGGGGVARPMLQQTSSRPAARGSASGEHLAAGVRTSNRPPSPAPSPRAGVRGVDYDRPMIGSSHGGPLRRPSLHRLGRRRSS